MFLPHSNIVINHNNHIILYANNALTYLYTMYNIIIYYAQHRLSLVQS